MVLFAKAVDQKKTVRVEGVGQAAVSRIMKAISRANQARLRQDPNADVVWGLPTMVVFDNDGVTWKKQCVDMVVAPQ